MIRTIAVLAFCGMTTTAAAADNGVYLGIGAGQSTYDVSGVGDDTDNGFKGLIGVRILDKFGVEANYQDHGRVNLPTGIVCIALVGAPCPTTARAEAAASSAFAVGFVALPVVDLFAKAGVADVDLDVRAPGSGTFNFSNSDREFAWGVGAQLHFGSLAARAELEQFKLPGSDEKLKAVSLSFVYTFL
jgi:hypothetical protein